MSLLSYIAESNKLWIAKIELELKKKIYDFYSMNIINFELWKDELQTHSNPFEPLKKGLNLECV